MLFSILIAQYNNGKYFKDCYDSIIAQTYNNWEVIIVDDLSTDNSLEIISAIIKEDVRFKLFVNKQNMGCGFTKNRCAALAKGIISGFLDPDDALMSEALESMVETHQKKPEVSLVHSTFYFCDELLNSQTVYAIPEKVIVDNRFTNLEAKVTAFSSYKNLSYQKTEGINPKLLRAVDQDLYLKLSEQGPFHFLDKPLYKYRIHKTGIATANTDKAFFWFLKVIAKAEERRGVNLENEVGSYLNRTDPQNIERNLFNPRFLILKLMAAFKKDPKAFIKKLFLNK